VEEHVGDRLPQRHLREHRFRRQAEPQRHDVVDNRVQQEQCDVDDDEKLDRGADAAGADLKRHAGRWVPRHG
jgi:hypothetical protein